MKKTILLSLLFISTIMWSQTVPKNSRLAITQNVKQNTATRVVVQDSITKELNWILKSSIVQPPPTLQSVLETSNTGTKSLIINEQDDVAVFGSSTNDIAFFGESVNNVAIYGNSQNNISSIFNIHELNTNDITQWHKDGDIQASISHDGKLTAKGANFNGSVNALDLSVNLMTVGRGGGNILGNVAVGYNALLSNVSGTSNTAVGSSSLKSLTSGINNTGFGFWSLANTTTGTSNSAMGFNSLRDNTTGIANVGIGNSSLLSNSIGSFNVGIGSKALYSNLADKNTSIGAESMYSNINGTFNTVYGQEGLRANIGGSYNASLGTFSLLNSESNFSTALGMNAGRESSTGNLLNSYESLFLGYNSKSLNSLSVNEIVIGSNAIGLGDNTTVLGNSATLNTSIKGNILLDEDKKLGIGVVTPNISLDVLGEFGLGGVGTDVEENLLNTKGLVFASNYFENKYIFPSSSITNSVKELFGGNMLFSTREISGGVLRERMRITDTGNIGVGTTNPLSKLHIKPSIYGGQIGGSISNSGVRSDFITIASNNTEFGAGGGLIFSAGGSDLGFAGIKGDLSDGSLFTTGSLTFSSRTSPFDTSITEKMRISPDGKVLIGMTEKSDNTSLLQVNGSALATQYKISALNTAPSSATDTGVLGEIRYDADYMYLCVATNTWKRSPLTTW